MLADEEIERARLARRWALVATHRERRRPLGMVRRLLVLTFLLVSAGLGARAAYACSCVPPPGVSEAVRQAEVAFFGEVTKDLGDGDFEVRVDGVLKGHVEPVVTVRTQGTGTCDTDLELGPLLYAYTADLHLNLCAPRWSDNIPARLAAAALTATPVAHPPDAGDDESMVAWTVPLAAGLVVAAGAVFAVARRRRNGAASAGDTASAG